MAHSALARARVWATVAFALQGLMQALVLTNLPGLEDRTGIGDTEVSGVVLSVLVFAAIGSLVGGAVAVRRGSAFLLVPAFTLQALAVLLAMINLPFAALFPVYALFGFGVGLGDAGNGMQGLTIQRAYGRPIFTTFYAFQTAAAIAGALLRPTGSSTMRAFGTPAARSCSAIRNRCSWLHTTIGGAKPAPWPRSAVSCTMVRSDSSGQSCFG